MLLSDVRHDGLKFFVLQFFSCVEALHVEDFFLDVNWSMTCFKSLFFVTVSCATCHMESLRNKIVIMMRSVVFMHACTQQFHDDACGTGDEIRDMYECMHAAIS